VDADACTFVIDPPFESEEVVWSTPLELNLKQIVPTFCEVGVEVVRGTSKSTQ